MAYKKKYKNKNSYAGIGSATSGGFLLRHHLRVMADKRYNHEEKMNDRSWRAKENISSSSWNAKEKINDRSCRAKESVARSKATVKLEEIKNKREINDKTNKMVALGLLTYNNGRLHSGQNKNFYVEKSNGDWITYNDYVRENKEKEKLQKYDKLADEEIKRFEYRHVVSLSDYNRSKMKSRLIKKMLKKDAKKKEKEEKRQLKLRKKLK